MPIEPRTRSKKVCRVIVTVRGGVAEVIFKPRGVEVSILDYDIEGQDADRVDRDPDGQLCILHQHKVNQKVVSKPNWPIVQSAIRELPQPVRRRWKCSLCKRIVKCSDESLAEAGTPYCADCDRPMKLL